MGISFQCMVHELLAAHNVRDTHWLPGRLELAMQEVQSHTEKFRDPRNFKFENQ